MPWDDFKVRARQALNRAAEDLDRQTQRIPLQLRLDQVRRQREQACAAVGGSCLRRA
jgi:hypothetical protein